MSDSKRPRAQRKKPGSEAQKAPSDIAILHSPTEDGRGARVVRIRDGEVSAGEIRPVREGEAVNQSEVVRLRPMAEDARVCEVEVLHAPEAAAKAEQRGASSGPARVSTANYRKNWSAIFEPEGEKKKPKSEWSVN